MSPSQKSMHNCRQLKVVSGVVLLVGLQLARGISHNFLLLHQHSTETLKGSITENLVGLGLIRRSKDRSCDEFLFESIEGNVTLRSLGILDMLLEEVGERLSNFGEVLDEYSAITCKPKETVELVDVLRSLPVHNCRNLFRIDRNALGRDDVTKVRTSSSHTHIWRTLRRIDTL